MKPKSLILLTALILTALLCAAPVAADAVTHNGKTYSNYDQIYASTTLSSSEKLALVQEMAGWTEELAAYMEWKNSGGLEAYQAAVSGNSTNSTSSDYGWNEAPGDGLGDSGNIEPEYSYQERQAYDAAYDDYMQAMTANYDYAAVTNSGGSGTQSDPYLISSLADLQSFRDSVNAGTDTTGKYWKLTANIDLNNIPWGTIGSDTISFNGYFDGNGHTISNVDIATTEKTCGFFTINRGYISNLKIESIDLTSSYTASISYGLAIGAGGIAGDNYGTISNCIVNDISLSGYSVSQTWASVNFGGIAGNNYGTISDCIVYGGVISSSQTTLLFEGGICGIVFSDSVTSNCIVHDVSPLSNPSRYPQTAGIIGRINDGTVSDCVILSKYISSSGNLGRITSAILEFDILENYALNTFKINDQIVSGGTITNKEGADITTTQATTQNFYKNTLGWDFDIVWYWDDTAEWQDATGTTYYGLPQLQVFKKSVSPTITAISATPSIGGQQDTYTLSVSASTTAAGGIASYQWYGRIGSSGEWQAISDGTSATYQFVPGAYALGDFYFKCIVTGADGGVIDSYDAGYTNVKVTVVLAPQITSPAATPASGPLSQTVQLSADVTSTESVTYQWQQLSGSTWQNIAGATSATYTANIADTAATTHSYRLQATNVGGTTTSATVTYTSVAPPTISSVTANPTTGPLTQSVTLSATVSGATSYQWQKLSGSTWQNIAGATSATYTVSIADSAATTHSYRLLATNIGGTTTSATVTYASVAAPTISSVTANPTTGPLTQSVTLSATVSGATSYQWQEQSGSTWQNIAGATSATYTANIADSAATTHSYRLLATNVGGTTTSATVTYASVAAPTISSVTANPTTGPLTQSVTLSATVSGATSYQWQKLSGSTWQNIAGATSATYTANIADTAATTHSYRLLATNVGGTTTSATVTYTSVVPPTINTVSATPASGPLSQTVTLTVSATGAAQYQWQQLTGTTWNNINGATASTHTVSISDNAPTLHSYRVVVSNVGGSITSDTVTYQSSTGPIINTISATPTSGPLTQTVQLSVTATSTNTISYQWEELIGNTWTAISGATTPTYSVSITDTNPTTHRYRVLATDIGGTTPSETITYTSIAPPNIQAVNINPAVGKYTETITLSAEVSGADTYQWQQLTGSTWQNISGATTVPWIGTLTVTGDTQYRLLATNAGGTTTSQTIQYTIAGPANIQSLTATPSVVAIPGSTTLQITGTNIVSVEWQKLSGSTWQTIGTGVSLTESITNVGETTFRALVEGADGTTTTSNNIVVLSGYAPSVDITEPINGDEFGVGNTITAQATVTGTDVLFEWGFGVNGVGNLNTNPTTITYTSQGYKTITITAESIFGTATDSVTILYGKAPRPMQTELFEEVDTTPVTNFVNQFDVEPGEMPNPVGIVASLFAPFDDALKGFFWVLMFGAVMLVVWLISKNIAIPSVLGILFGSFMIGFMPDMYLYPAVALIAAGCAGGLVYVVRKN